MATTLSAEKRRQDRRADLKEMRNNHMIPAVVYGKGMESKKVAVQESELIQTLRTAGNELITLEADGDKHHVLIAEIQKDNLKDQILHVDFRQVDMKTPVSVEVPIHIIGESKGLKEGGVLQQQSHTVMVKCLPNAIPSSIEVDITDLEIGEQLKLEDVINSEEYEVLTDLNTTLVSIIPPRLEPVEDKIEADTFVDEGDGKEHIFVEETE
jgi:large subunit ribosomal protein L25